MIKENKLITPLTGLGILPGITRAKIIQIAPSVGLKVEEELINVDFLKSADEVFLTSSLIEVMPVVKIDNTLINNGKIGKYAVILRERYREMVSGFLSKK